MRRELLPERPFRLHKRFRRRGVAVLLLVISFPLLAAAVGPIEAIPEYRRMARDHAIWNRGTPCAEGDAHFLGVPGDNELTVMANCITQDGRLLSTTYDVSIAVPSEAELEEIEIRYADDTTELAIGPVIDARSERELMLAIKLVVSGLFVGLALLIAAPFVWAMLRRRRTLRRGHETAVEITRVVSIRRGIYETHVRKVYWKLPGRPKTRMTKLDAKAGLAWIDGTQMRALAMVSPDGKFGFLLAGTLEPLELSDHERVEVTAKLEAAGGGLARGLDGELPGRVITRPA